MLETLRTASKTWVAKLILAAITVPFAFFGIDSYFRSNNSVDAIASVGDQKITRAEFDNAVKNQLDQFRSQFGDKIDASIMDNPEMRKSLLDQLVDQRVLTGAIQTVGLRVSDKALRERISTEPSWQDGGVFSNARYETFLKAQGMSAAGFENLMRKDMERQLFVESVAKTAITPSLSGEQFLLASEQSREVAIVNIAPEPFATQVKVTPEQAKIYYDGKAAEFAVPEQVRVEYLELSIDAIAPQMVVTPAEVKTVYDGNSARYVQKEERKASHILISVPKDAKEADKTAAKAKADALFAQVSKSPKDFADVAKKNSQDPGSAVAGGDLGFFAKDAMVKPFADAAFEAKKDDIVGPVLSDFGYHIIRLTDIRAEKSKSIAEVTPEIEGELKKQKAQRKFAESAEKLANLAYEQSNALKPAADAVGVTIKQSQWMSKGAGLMPPFSNPKLMAAIFSDEVIKNKRNTEAVEVAANSLVVARALESKPASTRPFPEVEQAIIARLTRDETGKLVKRDGEAKLAAVQSGQGDTKFPAGLVVSRAKPGGLSPNVVEAALKANPKTLPAYVGVDNPNGGYTLVQVSKIVDAPVDAEKAKAASTRVDQAVGQQQLLSLIAQLRSKSDVTIKGGALDKKVDNK
jgi:peptidyl-prolyl cis-trans isomerase D